MYMLYEYDILGYVAHVVNLLPNTCKNKKTQNTWRDSEGHWGKDNKQHKPNDCSGVRHFCTCLQIS